MQFKFVYLYHPCCLEPHRDKYLRLLPIIFRNVTHQKQFFFPSYHHPDAQYSGFQLSVVKPKPNQFPKILGKRP